MPSPYVTFEIKYVAVSSREFRTFKGNAFIFLKHTAGLSFLSGIAFTLCTTLYVVQQTPFSNFCFSNVGSLIKVILHEPCKNSAQERCVKQFAWLMTFYNPAHIRETSMKRFAGPFHACLATKFSQWCLYAHAQSGAECKTFDRQNKS